MMSELQAIEQWLLIRILAHGKYLSLAIAFTSLFH